MFRDFRGDIRYAARSLARRPLATAVAILSLALGIGVNTAMFSVFDRVILRRLPVPEPGQIVNVTSPGPRAGTISTDGDDEGVFSYPLFRDLERLEETGTSRLAAYRNFSANVAYQTDTAAAEGLLVSGGYFPALGMRPALGRLLAPEDDRVPGADQVVVLSYPYWSTRFGGRSAVVNETLLVNGEPMTIVGVTPQGFTGTTVMEGIDLFVPLSMASRMRPGWNGMERRNDHWLYVFARLRPGVTREQAQRALNAPFTALIREVEYPEQRTRMSARAGEQFLARQIVLEDGSRGRSPDRAEERTLLALLLAVTSLVLLIACANVANLLLTRAADRSAEITVRASMGASSARLMRLFAVEVATIALLGAAAALVVAKVTTDALLAIMPASDATLLRFELNGSILMFTALVSLGTGLLFGLAPALHIVRSPLATGLAVASIRASGSRSAARFRTFLATAQIALATALLAVAGLFITSLTNVARVELGLRPEGLATFSLAPRLNGYPPERVAATFEQVDEALRAMPGAAAVTASSVPLLSNNASGGNVTVEGFDPGPDADTHAFYARVGADYFRTIGVPLVAGREFTTRDAAEAPKVAIVNEAFARQFNLGPDPVGRRMRFGAGGPLDMEIVGLVRDAKYNTVKDAAPPQFFVPYRQPLGGALTTFTFYVRSTSDVRAIMSAIPGVVRRIDPTLPVDRLRTMDEQVWDNITPDRVVAMLSSSFAGLATLLAGIGLYAVLAYMVAQRVREIGIRMALGARTADVGRLVFAHVGRLILIGGVLGVAAALALGRLGEALLFGVDGDNLRVIAAAAAAVMIVVTAAAGVPARRAARVDPVIALRAE